MHIFMTNDDGFEASGIVTLARALSRIARITVVAPNRGRSSCSSSLSLHQYLRIWKKEGYGENITVYSCNGTTADCGKLALEGLLADDLPDLLVSGANNGFNTGSDCLYSGTMAGALEGNLLGIPSIAVSLAPSKDIAYIEKCAEFASKFISEAFVRNQYKGMLNLNIPYTEDISFDNLKVARLGYQKYKDAIRVMPDPSGDTGYWLSGTPVGEDATPDEDVYWIHRGKLTLTPITWNMTDTENLEKVKNWAETLSC